MIQELILKTTDIKNEIVTNDILREYYNAMGTNGRAALLMGIAAQYFSMNNILDIMMQMTSDENYMDIFKKDIVAFTSVPLNHNLYKTFLDNGKYYQTSKKFDILLSICGWFAKNSPNTPIDISTLEELFVSYFLVFIIDNDEDIPDDCSKFVDCFGIDNL